MNTIQRFSVIETALCIGGKVLDGEVSMILSNDYDAVLSREAEQSKQNEILRELINEGLARETVLREQLMEYQQGARIEAEAADEARAALKVALLDAEEAREGYRLASSGKKWANQQLMEVREAWIQVKLVHQAAEQFNSELVAALEALIDADSVTMYSAMEKAEVLVKSAKSGGGGLS